MVDEIVHSIAGLADPTLIGSGGFSRVYSALDTDHDRRVAVKILNEAPNPSTLRRFEQERRAMGRLSSHPNVVTIFRSGTTSSGNPFIVMELTTGGSLAERVTGGATVPWAEAVDLLIPVCDALAEAHQLGILHRDIKPENILLNRGRPLLSDFGIAHDLGMAQTTVHVRATWHHSPPETFDNQRDTRSDLYSVASTLHQLVAGRPPFWRADDRELSSLIWRVMNEPPAPLPPGLAPSRLEELLSRALAKDPAARPQSARELATELRQISDVSAPAGLVERTGPANDGPGGDQPGGAIGSPNYGAIGSAIGSANDGAIDVDRPLAGVSAQSAHRLSLPRFEEPAALDADDGTDLLPPPPTPPWRRAGALLALALVVLAIAVTAAAVTFR